MTDKVAVSENEGLSMSTEAKARMKEREVPVLHYYDDGGKTGQGHCTWGAGILAHLGPCTAEELARPVSSAEADAEFSRKVAKAERQVRNGVKKHALNQAQFDALVSLAYNAGPGGSMGTWRLIEGGNLDGAARNIKTIITSKINGKRVIRRGLISRRAEEAAPFETKKPDATKK